MSADRQRSILENTPARFSVADNPNANSDAPSYANLKMGAEVVAQHDAIIEEEARRVGVDPNLVRAVMYVERSQGNYFGGGSIADQWKFSKSILPMNINPYIWGPLVNGGKAFPSPQLVGRGYVVDEARRTFDNPRINIRAAAILLKRIVEWLDDPTPARVGSLYHFIGKELIDDYGARVGRVYRTREWENLQP